MERIRTLGIYQPFASLMLHGKIEIRVRRINTKPPFPLGQYLIYSTKKRYSDGDLLPICGNEIRDNIFTVLKNDRTKDLDQTAIAICTLVDVRPLSKSEEDKAFVLFKGIITRLNKNTENSEQFIQYGLHFEKIQPIEPFKWTHGKQGTGFVPETELSKIKFQN